MRLGVNTAIIGLAFGLSAFGDSIVIFNTGEGTGGTALTVGQTDPNYSLVSAPGHVPLTAIATSPNAAWTANTSSADWISPGSNGNTNWPVGTYDYQTTFSLAGLNPSTAQLTGEWTSDNNAYIELNGVSTGFTTGSSAYGSLNAFTITSGFKSGVNTLDFIVDNAGTSPNPSGIFAEVSGTATDPPVVPEPSSVSLVGVALLGLCGVFRRKLFGSLK